MAGGGSGGGTSGSLLGPAYVFTSPDVLTNTAADNALIPWIIGRGNPVGRIRASVKSPPDGDDIVVSIKRYTLATGVVVDTIGTVTIVDGDFDGTAVLVVAVTVLESQALAAEIDNVGTIDPGENLSLMVD